ncbi:MaoC/PaaZ C-terminal domain-containing protein [Alkalihalobacterium elongatum]|uniref:MaoC/PaaZ C-terminal domain-containing protein n=1 Tax=Alkalihalobacterium elongatum TaxID=2675466 RepID=UPI001C1FF231|nr:MaoC/PaaZ C-terminal domain-containing protein [Alkalihalobacterium elongatum]
MSQMKMSEYITITREQLVRYAGASGDFNPIHTNMILAKDNGLPDVIAQGMFIMGLAGSHLTRWFGLNKVKQFDVKFTAMTLPGERVQVICTINGEDTGGEVVVKNENEDVKLKGSIQFF